MAIDLNALVAALPAAAKPLEIRTDVVAPAGFAPQPWQTGSFSMPGFKPPVRDSAELQRILALPRREPPHGVIRQAVNGEPEVRTPLGEQYVAAANARFQRPRTGPCRCLAIYHERGIAPKPCIDSVNFVQAWSLHEVTAVHGLAGCPVGVGHGKTILDILIVLAFVASKRAVLLLPPRDVFNLVLTYELLAQHFHVPSLVVHGRGPSPQEYARAGMPQLHVVPYTKLSQLGNSDLLSQIAPDAVIADEADKLGDMTTATCRRVWRYFHENAHARFAWYTGSPSNDDIAEYAHLLLLSHRHMSPLPLDPDVVKEWGTAINPGPMPADPGALLKLCHPGESVRSGYRRRLIETPGVIATREAAVACDVVIEERPAPAIPQVVADALRELRDGWVRPDGEEFAEIHEKMACARQLACGFYYRWIFPRGEPRQLIDEWFAARKAWNRAVRNMLMDPKEHLDSDGYCRKAAQRAYGEIPNPRGLPVWKAPEWPAWRDIEKRVKPKTEAVRLHPFLAEDAAAWARDGIGVVWYADTDFGRWVCELTGLPMHTGGVKAPELIARENGSRSIIASIKAHGRGTDGLQRHFDRGLIATVPSSPKGWEQLVGRFARNGQRSSRVWWGYYAHTEELRSAMKKAIMKSQYVTETMGSAQKLLAGLDDDAYFDLSDED
jgi:hypothetical protein